MYRIGEVAALLNMNASALRYWEKQFPQIDPARTETGDHRMYTEKNVAVFRKIRQLLHEQGMTIAGAKRVLEGSAVIDENSPDYIVAVPDPAFMEMLKKELLEIREILTLRERQ